MPGCVLPDESLPLTGDLWMLASLPKIQVAGS